MEKEHIMERLSPEVIREVRFDGEDKDRLKALDLIDRALREYGNLGVYGDLSGGIKVLLRDMSMNVRQEAEYYDVSLFPRSGSGHDFSFRVDSATGKISDIAVGEIEPEPDW